MFRATAPTLSRVLALSAVALTAALAACGAGDAPQLDVQLSLDMPASVPLGEPMRMRYSWAAGADFVAPADDYQIFVHAVGPDGNILFQDDHYPPEPTSQWAAGGDQAYERWLYPPADVEVESLDFVVGMYSVDGRALLRGDGGTWTDAVDASRLDVRIEDRSGQPVYTEGWQDPEQSSGANGRSWRWTEGSARVVFTNPNAAAVLHLTGHGPFDEVGAQTVVLRAGATEVARLDITSADDFSRRIEIPASAMGDDDWVELTFEVTPVLVPKDLDPQSTDERTLGLQVFHLYLSSSS